MATRKVYSKRAAVKSVAGKRTARRHKSSTAGKIMPPLDVRSDKHLADFKKRITKGPLTIVLVYADWCGHCHTMMPHFDAASKSPNRSIQAVKVNEQMLPAVNAFVNKNINKSAKPLNVEGYPSIILVNNKGEKVTDIEPVRDTNTMTQVMNESADIANKAQLNTVKPNNNSANMVNVGVKEEEKGLVVQKNSNVGEDELKGSIEVNTKPNKNLSLKAVSNKKEQNSTNNAKNIDENTKAPSPLNTFSGNSSNSEKLNKNVQVTPPAKNVEKEAEAITSLTAPVEPPSMSDDIESLNASTEQKISGGAYKRKGGSLMEAMARTTYTIAAPAALFATAAMVLKGKKSAKSHKKHKAHKARKFMTRRR